MNGIKSIPLTTYIVTRACADGSEEEVTFRVDYCLKTALNNVAVPFVGGLIGIKPAKGAIRWYLGGLKVEDIKRFQQEKVYAGGSD